MLELRDKVSHVIVLMLENRSFDHMLGHTFDPARLPVPDPASYVLPVDPDHSHRGVMWQLLGHEPPEPPPPAPTAPLTMSGFADCYARRAGDGPAVLRGFRREQVPVLSTLALEYATCTRWFCSVPGQTWPNRNYAHAATSDGEVDIVVRLYHNPTIFERIEDAGRSWRVYHQGPAQVWCYPALWPQPGSNRFDDHDDLLDDIRNDRLPSYAFVEPDHGLVFREALDASNSQHPGNNTRDGRDFLAGERLLHSIYSTLVARPEVWRRTLLIVTYDEHGGFADHVAPPAAVAPGGRSSDVFGFTLLGPRVPTLLISPWIPRGTRDERTYEHSAIPRALRELFAPKSAALTRRDAAANLLLDNLSLDAPRTDLPMPVLPAPERAERAARVARASAALAQEPRELDSFQQSLIGLSEIVDRQLRAPAAERTTRAERDSLAGRAPASAFTTEGERQFFLQDVVRRFQKAGGR